MDEPAPPDVAPRAREPRAVRRVARPAPAAARRQRRQADPATPASRRRAAARHRRPACALAARRPAAPLRPRARAQPRACCRCSCGARRAGSACAVRCCGRTCRRPKRCSRRSTRRSSSTTASTTSPPSRASTAPASARPRPASRGAPTSCWRARRRSRSACGRSTRNVLYAPNVADTGAVRARAGAPARSTRRSTRCRARGSSSPARSSRRSSTCRCSCELARARPQWSFALVGPVGAGRPTHRRLRARGRAERPPARRAPLRRAARRAARGRRRADPVRAQRADRRHLPDEGVRVPRRRPAGRRDRAAVARRRRRRSRRAPTPPASPRCSTTRSPRRPRAPRASARARPRRTRGTRGWRRSRRAVAGAGARDDRAAVVATLSPSHADPALGPRACARTASHGRSRRPAAASTLVYVRFGGDEPDAAHRAIPGVALRGGRALARPAARARLGAARAGAACPTTSRAASRRSSSRRRGGSRRATRARVIADGPIAAAALAGLARRRPVIYNAHNLESAFRHELEASAGSARRSSCGASSAGCWRASPSRWMVSRGRLARRARAVPEARPAARPERRRRRGDRAGRRAVAAAPRRCSSPTSPTRRTATACAFLLDEVMPRVWAPLPDAACGSSARGLEAAAPGADPRVERRSASSTTSRRSTPRAACAVVPLLQGGGTPLKFVEALAYGAAGRRDAARGCWARGARRRALPAGRGRRRACGGADAACCATARRPRRAPAARSRAERYSIEALTALLAR